MPNNILARVLCRIHMVVAAWVACMSPTHASVVYNYGQDWLFDSATGLYWQTAQVPSSTLIPSAGTIADVNLVMQLASDAGIPSLFTGANDPAAPYSPTLANFLSFFASDAPASPRAPIAFDALYRFVPDLQLGGYEYLVFSYTRDTHSSGWLYFANTTIGTYGPGSVCEEPPCSPTVPAFVYSTVQPTPLPATAWLLVAGLAVLGVRTIRVRPDCSPNAHH